MSSTKIAEKNSAPLNMRAARTLDNQEQHLILNHWPKFKIISENRSSDMIPPTKIAQMVSLRQNSWATKALDRNVFK